MFSAWLKNLPISFLISSASHFENHFDNDLENMLIRVDSTFTYSWSPTAPSSAQHIVPTTFGSLDLHAELFSFFTEYSFVDYSPRNHVVQLN